MHKCFFMGLTFQMEHSEPFGMELHRFQRLLKDLQEILALAR